MTYVTYEDYCAAIGAIVVGAIVLWIVCEIGLYLFNNFLFGHRKPRSDK